jgi:hypothetical protein
MTDTIRTFVTGEFLHRHKIMSGIEVIKNFAKINGVLPYPKKKAMIGLISVAMFSSINVRVK